LRKEFFIPVALVLVLSNIHNDTVIPHFVIWTSLSALSYYNGSQRIQNKQTGNCSYNKEHNMHNPETLEIIRKPGSATSQSIFMAAYKIELLNTYGIKKSAQ
jgi:hypothetical protein